jgi:hypothetical protein
MIQSMMKHRIALFMIACIISAMALVHQACAQIPVEIFTGEKHATLDILFFKNFLDEEQKPTPWLFFSRTRTSIDYRMTSTEYLPQFGLTEAISYNHAALHGFAPVIVGQVFNAGVYLKAGAQYVHIASDFIFFSWLVLEIEKNPAIDFFALMRYTPRISSTLKLFLQAEFLNVIPTHIETRYGFTQRVRAGISWQRVQCGVGADFHQSGRSAFQTFENIGLFVRYEF